MSDTTQFEISRVHPTAARSAEAQAGFGWAGLNLPLALDRALGLVCVCVVVAALVLVMTQPQHVLVWFSAGSFLPLALLGLHRIPTLASAPHPIRRSLGFTLIGAGVLVLIALLLRLSEGLGILDIAGVRRLIGVMIGGGLIVFGRFLPFQLLSIARRWVETALAERLLSFVGSSVMLSGGLYGFLWLVAPLSVANLWASLALVGAALFIGCRCVLMVNHRNR